MANNKKTFKSSDEHLIAVLLTFNKHIKLVGKMEDEYIVEFTNGKFVADILQKHLNGQLSVDFDKYKEFRNILSEI